jgi:hypothetical protein
MTQGQKRRGCHTDVDLATIIDSNLTCQTTEMFEMGQKKASGCLPCRAIQRMIDFSALDFVYLAFFFFISARSHTEKKRDLQEAGVMSYIEMHTVDALTILYLYTT